MKYALRVKATNPAFYRKCPEKANFEPQRLRGQRTG
jgi:hypothetical protein